jgi:hypothetical protein
MAADYVWLLEHDAAGWNDFVRTTLLPPTSKATLNLRGIELPGADLSGRDFRCVDLTGANFKDAKLNRANFGFASLRHANLVGASCCEAFFHTTDLTGADLAEATLFDARFVDRTDLTDARLVGALLWWAMFRRASIVRTDFAGAKAQSTVWADVDLCAARNLENMIHSGPSPIGLNTVTASRGQIPEVFLRGCGVPDEMIAYVCSLGRSRQPLELYSCFISYSSKDDEFCQRLHNDLQAAGVRCWFAPEDLKIGDRLRDEIEGAIRLHDKLLLVLSDTSVNSSWVRTEVGAAFEREERERKQVLFPIRLDDAVLDSPTAWAADIRRQRHVGNFTQWRDHNRYRKAFDRLLRDLRAPPTT